ncbi:hypothetical protein PoB_000826200 [Plakobranchus ocellatus]|uniref:Uncharacterized protein n=1 Tax=Plakobranchus ocellatus TaxID=259542 RepID=A0AAV3YHR2_9GAST|nr:hypothetical protein PoB_000826200 [Plakobranchus ocellatus]
MRRMSQGRMHSSWVKLEELWTNVGECRFTILYTSKPLLRWLKCFASTVWSLQRFLPFDRSVSYWDKHGASDWTNTEPRGEEVTPGHRTAR